MKIAVAAACLVALAGCAGMQPLLDPKPAPIAASGTYYCWRDRLTDEGSSLGCNWERSADDACKSTAWVSLAKSNVSGMPRNSRRCENGQWLVTVTSR